MARMFPYLLLVSFASGPMNSFGPEKVAMINASPYDGVAVALIGAYDEKQYSVGDFSVGMKQMKASSRKHIWPWVFLNRMVGLDPKVRDLPSARGGAKFYFERIRGMDLYNETGALDDFLHLFTLALTIAKELESPGIVLDLEVYNDYNTYRLSRLAEQLGKPEETLVQRLRSVGARLTRIAHDISPRATVWLLFSGLATPEKARGGTRGPEFRTITYLVQGMLEEAKKLRSELKYISGGEVTLGYCHRSLADLKEKIEKRSQRFKPLIAKYPHLRLGGTIAPWARTGLKKDWMTRGECGASELEGVADFLPLVAELLRTYTFVWVFATGNAPYNPYDPVQAKVYNDLLLESKRTLERD